MSEILIALFFTLFVLQGKVHAYLDPGTGSYLYQLALAGLLGGTFVLSTFVKKIVQRFKKKRLPPIVHEHNDGQA